MFDLQGRQLHTAIAASAGSAYLLFGYDQGVLGGLVAQPSFLSAIGNPSDGFLGTIVALFNIGCLAGCVISAIWGNVLGRKRTIIWGCIVMIIGGIVQASTYGSAQLIAGRIISGIGNGMSTPNLCDVHARNKLTVPSSRYEYIYGTGLYVRDISQYGSGKDSGHSDVHGDCTYRPKRDDRTVY